MWKELTKWNFLELRYARTRTLKTQSCLVNSRLHVCFTAETTSLSLQTSWKTSIDKQSSLSDIYFAKKELLLDEESMKILARTWLEFQFPKRNKISRQTECSAIPLQFISHRLALFMATQRKCKKVKGIKPIKALMELSWRSTKNHHKIN